MINHKRQMKIGVRVQVIVNYRLFLAAPVRFHEQGPVIVLKEGCRAERHHIEFP
jgi:hypothetical protein